MIVHTILLPRLCFVLAILTMVQSNIFTAALHFVAEEMIIPTLNLGGSSHDCAATGECPSTQQLRAHFLVNAIPMIGFAFMDNTVMIHAGNYLDCTLGVTFGLSTLTAAALGQVCSNMAGVLFGDTLELIADTLVGVPNADFTADEMALPTVRRIGILGSLCGVVIGCCLGLINLFFVDTERSSTLKLRALTDEQRFAFEVTASNNNRADATTFTVRGPDVDGMLASMTAALTARDCSVVELHAQSGRGDILGDATPDATGKTDKGGNSGRVVEDIFVVQKNNHRVNDDELEDLARSLLAASKDPLSAHSLKAHAKDLEAVNAQLLARVIQLEKVIEDRQITVVKSVH